MLMVLSAGCSADSSWLRQQFRSLTHPLRACVRTRFPAEPRKGTETPLAIPGSGRKQLSVFFASCWRQFVDA